MSRLKITGSASGEFTVDQFEITFRIRAVQQTSGDAIETGRQRTEQFLQTMQDALHLSPDDFLMHDFSVQHGFSGQEYTYEKAVVLRMTADLGAAEQIAALMESMSDIAYDVSFSLSDEAEKEQTVLQSAISDARQKADRIAAALGKKIIGIEDVDDAYAGDAQRIGNDAYRCKSIPVAPMQDLASSLKNPVMRIEKNIHIVWIME